MIELLRWSGLKKVKVDYLQCIHILIGIFFFVAASE